MLKSGLGLTGQPRSQQRLVGPQGTKWREQCGKGFAQGLGPHGATVAAHLAVEGGGCRGGWGTRGEGPGQPARVGKSLGMGAAGPAPPASAQVPTGPLYTVHMGDGNGRRGYPGRAPGWG
jgi:hypothetical protein